MLWKIIILQWLKRCNCYAQGGFHLKYYHKSTVEFYFVVIDYLLSVIHFSIYRTASFRQEPSEADCRTKACAYIQANCLQQWRCTEMNMNNRKLSCVVSDLDGTLLNSYDQISNEDLATIKRLKADGVYVFLMTGRHVAFTKEVASMVGFDMPVCACNGGHIYNYLTGETIFVDLIPGDLPVKIYDFLNERRVPYIIYTPEMTIFSDNGERYKHWMKLNNSFAPENRFIPGLISDESFDICKQKVIKYLVLDESGTEIEKEFQELFNKNRELSVVRSGSEFFDINAPGVHKGIGLRILSEIYGFSMAETLALGDNDNDEEMLCMAGYSAAPENAVPSIKKLAAFVTTTNSASPLTHAIQHFCPGLL